MCAVCGAPFGDSNETTPGAAYVFTEGLGGWAQAAKLRANDGGEGDRFYIFFTTTAAGDKTRRALPDGTELIRDLHGGGYHGGWGGAARMRIYRELAAAGMLSDAERALILQHGPWPPPAPRDSSNRSSGVEAAIGLGEMLFFDHDSLVADWTKV